MRQFKKGDRVILNGDSVELGINDYDCRVDTSGTVIIQPYKGQKKIAVTAECIDHDSNVMVRVYADKLKRQDIAA